MSEAAPVATPAAPPSPKLWKLLLKTLALTLAFLLILIIITASLVGIFAKKKLDQFTSAAGVSAQELWQTAQTGWHTTPVQNNGHVNFLILGTDDLANRDHAAQLTDTMMLVSLNLHSGQVNMYSLPRDLWLDNYKTKINALYEYGKTRFPGEPQRFPTETVADISGVSIQHTVLINLQTLADMIDTMGGIDVTIPQGFVDTQFPNPDVDVTKVHDPKLLYMTVEFKQGVEHMNGARVLEYVRSRHSADETQGNDVARGQRQQEIILNMIADLKQPTFWRDVPRAGRLYKFYVDHFAAELPITQAIAIGRQLLPVRNQVQFTSHSPTIFPDDPNGVITHPKPAPQYLNQWVYIIRNPGTFQKEVQADLQ